MIGKFFHVFDLEKPEFREPFLGGGGVFLFMKQSFPQKRFWINDLNYNLYVFWKVLKENGLELMESILELKEDFMDRPVEQKRKLHDDMKNFLYSTTPKNELDIAIAYYVCNKTSFSGLEVGSFSAQAFERNFTINNIKKFPTYSELLDGVRLTNLDYTELFNDSQDSMIYLDPPYELKTTKNILYGENGQLHEGFDHLRFRREIERITGKFCISYNSDDFIRDRYSSYRIEDLQFTYFANQGKDGLTRQETEVLIMNY